MLASILAFLPALSVVKNYMTPILIIIGLALGGFVLYKGYSTIVEIGTLRVENARLLDQLENKDKQIQILEKDVQIRENIISARDVQLDAVREKLNNLTNDLGEGANEQSSPALKELFRRLGQQ